MSTIQADIEARLSEVEPEVEVLLAEVVGGDLVRLFIDHPQGVTLDLCERVTHHLPEVRERYALEVSSPGTERPLSKPEHFRRYVGRRARIMGLWRVGAVLGSGAGFAIAGALATSFGWRASFVVFGICGFVCALLVERFLPEPERGVPDELQRVELRLAAHRRRAHATQPPSASLQGAATPPLHPTARTAPQRSAGRAPRPDRHRHRRSGPPRTRRCSAASSRRRSRGRG